MTKNPIIGIVLAIIILAGSVIVLKQRNSAVPLPSASITPTETPTDIVNEHTDLIRIASPRVGERVSSTTPLKVTGEARGQWYFEATFPITVVNWDGLIIGEGYATAQGEWMTEEFVPFEGTITFTKPDYGTRGAVIFKNSNASGDPIRDKAVEIPIEFI